MDTRFSHGALIQSPAELLTFLTSSITIPQYLPTTGECQAKFTTISSASTVERAQRKSYCCSGRPLTSSTNGWSLLYINLSNICLIVSKRLIHRAGSSLSTIYDWNVPMNVGLISVVTFGIRSNPGALLSAFRSQILQFYLGNPGDRETSCWTTSWGLHSSNNEKRFVIILNRVCL